MKPRVIIVPRQGAGPGDAFYPWLVEALAQRVPVICPRYLRPDAPRLEEWAPIVLAQLWEAPEQAVLVAHGLGCRAAIHALTQLRSGVAVGGLICVASSAVSAVSGGLPSGLPSPWTEPVASLERAHGALRGRCVFLDAEGDTQPPEVARWIDALHADVRRALTNRDLDGPEAPVVLEAIEAMLSAG